MKTFAVGDMVEWEGKQRRIDKDHMNGMYTLSNNDLVTNYELEAGFSEFTRDKLMELGEEIRRGKIRGRAKG